MIEVLDSIREEEANLDKEFEEFEPYLTDANKVGYGKLKRNTLDMEDSIAKMVAISAGGSKSSAFTLANGDVLSSSKNILHNRKRTLAFLLPLRYNMGNKSAGGPEPWQRFLKPTSPI